MEIEFGFQLQVQAAYPDADVISVNCLAGKALAFGVPKNWKKTTNDILIEFITVRHFVNRKEHFG